MLVFALLISLALIAVIITALIVGMIAFRTSQKDKVKAFWKLLSEKLRIMLGVSGVVIGLLIFYVVVEIRNEPPAPCTAGLAPISQKPVALVSATDYFAQGDYDYERGVCDAAIEDYTRAIELNPNFAEAYNNRAYTYMMKHNYAAALPDLNKAIELRPDYINALMNRGDIYNYYYNIDYDLAIADYDRILQLRPWPASICGHRLLAQHHGWDLGVFMEVFVTKGFKAGCE